MSRASVQPGTRHPNQAYRADIDGLRAVAIIPVVVFHAFPTVLRGGFVGVDIFFVISGFLITRIIGAECNRGSFSYANFYARRIRRIFPALLTILSVALLLGWAVLFDDEFSRLGNQVLWSAAFVENLNLQREVGYFDVASELKPLLHIWSLGVEEQFYILWPIILVLVWRRGRTTTIYAIAFLVAGSLIISQAWVSLHPMAAFYSPISRFWELGFGGALAIREIQGTRNELGQKSANILGCVGAVLLCFAFLYFHQRMKFPGLWALVPVVGTCLLILVGTRSWFNETVLSNRVAVWIGRISYPLYLWHWLLLSFARILFPADHSSIKISIVLVVTLALSWLTFRFIERPFQAGAAKPIAVPVLCVGMLVVAALGYLAQQWVWLPRLSNVGLDSRGFTAARQSDGSCQRLLGIPAVPEEVCRTNSRHPSVLIAGDSHAMSLASAAEVGKIDLGAILVAGHGCYLFDGVTQLPVFPQQWANNCPAIIGDVIGTAKTIDSIKTIVVAAFGAASDEYDPAAAASRDRGSQSDAYVYKDAAGRSIHYRQAFLDGYASLLRELEKTGKRIVFVVDVPYLDVDPHDCVSRIPLVREQSCDLPRSRVDASQSDYRKMTEQIERRFPNVDFFDATAALCNAQTCPARVDRAFLYYDKHHLTVGGSKILLEKIFGRSAAR